jgi:hypothetical protein
MWWECVIRSDTAWIMKSPSAVRRSEWKQQKYLWYCWWQLWDCELCKCKSECAINLLDPKRRGVICRITYPTHDNIKAYILFIYIWCLVFGACAAGSYTTEARARSKAEEWRLTIPRTPYWNVLESKKIETGPEIRNMDSPRKNIWPSQLLQPLWRCTHVPSGTFTTGLWYWLLAARRCTQTSEPAMYVMVSTLRQVSAEKTERTSHYIKK